MEPVDFQKAFFKEIIFRLGEKKALETLSGLLHLNKSAIYHRINADTPLKLAELLLLSKYFALPLDAMIQGKSERADFVLPTLNQPVKSCADYLTRIQQHFEIFSRLPDIRVWFSSNSLGLFQHFHFRELALFKLFAYARINWQLPYTEHLIFHPDTFPENHVYHSHVIPILQQYNRLDSTEFWSDEMYDFTLKHLRYFKAAGQMKDTNLLNLLYKQLYDLCDIQEEMVRKNRKNTSSGYASQGGGQFEIYFNEVAPVNVTLVAESSATGAVFFALDDPNYMVALDQQVVQYTLQWMRILQSKCILLSSAAEHVRKGFFDQIRVKIHRHAALNV
jgi:hypothetical protein